MLLAYALSATGALTADTIEALRRAERAVGPGDAGLGLRLDEVVPGPVDGTFARGQARPADRHDALAVIDGLRRLSREFPGVSVFISGWGELPPSTLRAGAFSLFGEAYDRALAELASPERRWRCS